MAKCYQYNLIVLFNIVPETNTYKKSLDFFLNKINAATQLDSKVS